VEQADDTMAGRILEMQVNYIPYLNMKDVNEVNFPDLTVKIWNYGLMKNAYITDPDVLARLDTIMGSNVHYVFQGMGTLADEAISDMGIISVGDIDFREYTDSERKLAREARLRLFAGALVWNLKILTDVNRGHRMVVSENFDMVWQGFSTQDDHFGIRGGSIIQKNDMGYKLGDMIFRRPQQVMSPMSFNIDDDTLGLLARLYRKNKKLYRRIIQAIEVVVQAYYNDDKIPESQRVLSMSSALETLFDILDSRQREHLKNTMNSMFVLPSDPKRRYKSSRGRAPAVWEHESIKVMWADRFYELRSAIIHGDKIKSDDYNFLDKQRHLDIALLVFGIGMQKIIKQALGITDYTDELVWEKHVEAGEPPESPFNREGFVYEDNALTYAIHQMLVKQMKRQKP